jgi:hypothetical protein
MKSSRKIPSKIIRSQEDNMDEAQAKFTHSTALIIHLWSALDIAVQNEWAGPESSNIRDWLGGVIVDMFSFPAQKKVDVEDVEDVLLQVLEDEFELRLEDDSAYQVGPLKCMAKGRLRGILSSRMSSVLREIFSMLVRWRRYIRALRNDREAIK